MKWIVSTVALLLSSLATAQDVVVVQINAKWNRANTLEDLRYLKNCEYVFGWLENQPHEIQSSIQAVPVIVVYDKDVPCMQYAADIMLKPSVTASEVQSFVNSLVGKD